MADSKYTIDLLLNWKAGVASGGTFPAPKQPYLAVFSVAPAYDGTGGTEISATAFSGRVAFAAGAPTVNTAGVSDQIVNSALEDLGNNIGSSTVTVAAFALYDALTGGNMLTYAPLTSSVQVAPGSDFSFAASAIKEIAS